MSHPHAAGTHLCQGLRDLSVGRARLQMVPGPQVIGEGARLDAPFPIRGAGGGDVAGMHRNQRIRCFKKPSKNTPGNGLAFAPVCFVCATPHKLNLNWDQETQKKSWETQNVGGTSINYQSPTHSLRQRQNTNTKN